MSLSFILESNGPSEQNEVNVIGTIIYLTIVVVLFIYAFVRGIERKKIINNSKFIQEINKVNDEFGIEDYSKTLKYHRYFDDVRNYRHFNPDFFLAQVLIDNLESFKRLIDNANNMNVIYPKYLEKYEKLTSTATEDDAEKIHVRFSRYRKIEEEYFTRNKKDGIFDIKFVVYWHVENTARKAKTKKVYTFDDAKHIFNSYYRKNVKEDNVRSGWIQKERSLMTDSLRYDILRRDGFRCQICGATAQDGVKLHVDHIIPVSKGGKTEPSNLRTLCDRCNLGKSDKIE